jgi:predicted metal-dependent peptidase
MKLNDLKEKFDAAIEELQEQNHYLAAEVTKLGYPVLSDQIPTAGVAWDPDRKKVMFMFNPKFAEICDNKEFKFTVVHESTHLLNAHVFLLRDEIEKMKRLNKTNAEMSKFIRKFNRAADCVVNDTLTNLYGLEKVFYDGESGKKLKIIYGKETVGIDCQDLTAMDVYYLLPDPPAQPNQNKGEKGETDPQFGGGSDSDVDNHGEWESFFNPDGTVKREFVDALKDFIQDNIQNSSLSDEEAKALDDMKDKMANSTDSYASQAGNAAIGNKRPIDGLGRETLNWNKILFQLVDTLKPEDVWTKVNRKLLSVYPDIILPSSKDKEKEKLFVAIDTSGSIDHNALKLFLTVLKNTPKRFQIDAITFDTRCYPFDVKKGKEPLGGGGTNFGIIENYIQNNFKKYPKAVFILTDGYGSPVSPQHPDRWCWMLYGSAYTGFCGTMKHHNIRDLLLKP